MNPVALTTMLSLFFGVLALLAYALHAGAAWLVALVVIVAVGLFVRWG